MSDALNAMPSEVAGYVLVYKSALIATLADKDRLKAENERLRREIQEAINMLGMDRPIDPCKYLRAALNGGSNE